MSRDIGIQKTEGRIRESRYAEELRKLLLETERSKYLEGIKDRQKKEIEIARFRLRSESRGGRYWMGKERQMCRACVCECVDKILLG